MKYRVWVFSSIMRRFVALEEFPIELDANCFRFQWQSRRMCTAIEKVPPLCGICELAEGDWADKLKRLHSPQRRVCPGHSWQPLEVPA